MTGILHVGLAALGAAIAVGIDRHEGVGGRRTQSRRGDEDYGPVDPGDRLRRGDRVLRAVPREVSAEREAATDDYHDRRCMTARRRRRPGRGDRPDVRRGLAAPDRPDHQLRHRLRAAVLARLQAVLRMLEKRRQQIAAGPGEHREDQRRARRIEAAAPGHPGRGARRRRHELIDEARDVATRCSEQETQRAVATAEQIVAKAREAADAGARAHAGRLRREVGRLVVQTTAAVTGKVLTPDDQRRLAEETARQLAAVVGRRAIGDEDHDEQSADATARAAVPAVPGRRRARRGPRRGRSCSGSLDGRPPRRARRPVALSAAGAARSRRGTAPTSRARRRSPTTCARDDRGATWRALYGAGDRHVVHARTRRSSAACASQSAATSTTAASGPAGCARVALLRPAIGGGEVRHMANLIQEIEAQIAGAKTAAAKQNVGVIREIGDGVARVEGLGDVMLNEMLDFGHGITGLALNLEETEVGVIILGDYTKLQEGDEVRATGKLLQVPVGKGLLGRVVNTLGEPVDGKGPIASDVAYPVEKIAPGIMRRRPISQPVQTGIMADRRDDPDRARPARADHRRSLHRQDHHLHRHDHQPGAPEPGRGGGRRQGLSSALLHLCRHRPEAVDDRPLISVLEEAGAMPYTIVLAAPAVGFRDEPVSGAVRRRRHGRVVHGQRHGRADRLRRSLQARGGLSSGVARAEAAIRPRSLPGRRLLSAQPPARTRGARRRTVRQRLADGAADHRDAGRRRLRLHSDERHLDHRRSDLPGNRPVLPGHPAGDLGRHLGFARRIGRADQGDETGRRPLKGDLAQFRELAAFAQFGSELDATTQAKIDRGKRIVELFKQPQYNPVPVEVQVAVLWAVQNGYVDDVPVERIKEFQAGSTEFLTTREGRRC